VARNRKAPKLIIGLGSAALFGAERRFLKIIQYLETNFPDTFDILLVTNSRMYRTALAVPWCADVMAALERKGRLTVLPDRLGHVGELRGLMTFLSHFFGDGPGQFVLQARVLAYARALIGRDAAIEVTSPEIATKLGRLPAFLLKRIRFICVSPSTYKRFLGEVRKRFPDEQFVSGLRVRHSSIPFFDTEANPVTIGSKENIVVSASRFLERKNVVLFAKGLKRALPRMPGWTGAILGKGPTEDEIRAILADEIAAGQVHVGYDPKIMQTLARSKIYASVIEPDNYPSQSILEAMQCGNALLLSNTGNSDTFLAPGHSNGRLVDLTEESIADTLVAMASDESALAAMAQASIALIDQKFSHKIYIREFIDQHLQG
jgi:glycosyltransferase involved in cell wall biosynthesis